MIADYFEKHPKLGSLIVGGIFLSIVTGAAYQLLFKAQEEHFSPLLVHSMSIDPYQLGVDRKFTATFELSLIRDDCKIAVTRVLIDESGKHYTENFDPADTYKGVMDRKIVTRDVYVKQDFDGEISFMQLFTATCPEKKYVIPSPVQQFRMPS